MWVFFVAGDLVGDDSPSDVAAVSATVADAAAATPLTPERGLLLKRVGAAAASSSA